MISNPGMNLMEGKSDLYTELKEKFWSTFWVN